MEEKLQSKNFYRLKFDSIPDAFIAIDKAGKVVAWDEEAEKNFGWLAEEIIGISSYEALFPEAFRNFLPNTGRKAAVGHTVDLKKRFEITAYHKDGTRIPVTMALVPFRTVELIDITEIRILNEREAALQLQLAALEQQASLLDLTRDAVIVRAAHSDIITYWNSGAERLYQFTRQEAVGKVIHDLLKTEFSMPYEQIQSIVAKNGFWEGEVVQRGRNGQEIIVHSQWVMESRVGQPQRYLETNTDITQRVQAERALAKSREDYRLLVDASTEYAIITLDPDGMIVSWNPGAEKVLRFTEKEALGQPISAMFTMEDDNEGPQLRELKEALATGRSENDCWHIRQDGSRFWATGVVTPLWNQDGTLRGYVKIMRDETAQRVEEEGTQFLAHHDGLTGLHNRVSFSNELHKQ